MTTRTFVFCDICNPDALRNLELRRSPDRGDYGGRRNTDGRAWIGRDVETAIQEHGWILTTGGAHICPHCMEQAQQSRKSIQPHDHEPDGGRSFIFCDCCNIMGVRFIEQRRRAERTDGGHHRRLTDDRSWFEDDEDAAKENGWVVTEDGRHYCPKCRTRHPDLIADEIYIDQVEELS